MSVKTGKDHRSSLNNKANTLSAQAVAIPSQDLLSLDEQLANFWLKNSTARELLCAYALAMNTLDDKKII